jgi:hypothetical protein
MRENQAILSSSIDTSQNNHSAGAGGSSIRNMTAGGSSNVIHGRRIDSPDLKVAVNREIHEQRPHTAGYALLMQYAGGNGGGLRFNNYGAHSGVSKKDDYMTISNYHNQNNHHRVMMMPESITGTAAHSANNTLTISHNY